MMKVVKIALRGKKANGAINASDSVNSSDFVTIFMKGKYKNQKVMYEFEILYTM